MKFTPTSTFVNRSEIDEHDSVVLCLRDYFSRIGTSNQAYSNPNNKRRHPIEINGKKYYPDLVVCHIKDLTKPIALIEVKTASDLTAKSAAQLKKYASFHEEVHLFVPKSSLVKAESLCFDHEIKCILGSYAPAKTWLGRFTWQIGKYIKDLR